MIHQGRQKQPSPRESIRHSFMEPYGPLLFSYSVYKEIQPFLSAVADSNFYGNSCSLWKWIYWENFIAAQEIFNIAEENKLPVQTILLVKHKAVCRLAINEIFPVRIMQINVIWNGLGEKFCIQK